jgi:superfamily II DNA or RNA helicase
LTEEAVALGEAGRRVAPHPVPEQGQLVEVRKRQFVVAEVARSALPTDGRAAQHLVSLTSIEDDALGEQVQVVWEIEPGARVLERAGLPKPEGFDDPERLEAFLHAVRWGAVTDADYQALQSPFRSGITIEDYQLDPVVRAIQMPRANLLVADDVGLGKTIEAGLVIQELILRHRARTVLVVCPASLQLKWHDELRDKFGLEFRIVDTDLLKELRRSRGIHVNPWTHFPRLITSIDWLKRDIPMRMFRDVLPPHPTYPRPFDILVVDEAHNVAPTGSANYVLDSQRTQAIRALATHFEHRLFLTATPHNGYQVSFTSLLELLDQQRFARGIPPDQERLARVMVRRMKGDIVDWKGEPKFARREIVPIEVDYTDQERRIHRALVEYARLRQEATNAEGDRYATEFVLKLLKKRLFSSPAAFAQTLEKHRRSLTEGPKRAERGRQAVRILRRAIGETEEEYADDTRFEESLGEAVQTAGSLVEKLSQRELELLDGMSAWAERARSRPDAKVHALLEWLQEHIRPDGEWTDRRVIVFTEYRATQNYLVEMLTAHGFGDPDRLMTMYGGMDDDQREQIKAAFQASPEESAVRILVATDAASEGIDLQNHCNLMIHAEIPWNPNRLEQRNGRIDRHGQRQRQVLVHHFVGAGYKQLPGDAEIPVGELEADLEFLMHAVRKVEQIREDLGRVGTVIAEQVEQAMLGRRRRLDTDTAETQAKAASKVLAVQKRIGEQIERLHERLLESRKRLQLTPENVRKVVEVGLEIAGQPPLQPASLPGLDPRESPVFQMPAFSGTWTVCTQGLAHPHTGQRRPITFDHRVIEGRDDLVLVHLEHRLVQLCLRLLRAEVWAPDRDKRLHRVTAGILPDAELDTPAVVGHARLVVIGEDRHRLHEEVVRAGGVIRQGRFARLNVGQVDSAVEHMRPDLPPEPLLRDLGALWPKLEHSLVQALEARKADRMQYLLSTLQRRRDKDIEDITRILEELKTSVEAELARELEPEQLQIWADPERDQFRRNLNSLRARVAAIPEEIQRETEVTRRRYANPDARLFPVALTFLVPESLCR